MNRIFKSVWNAVTRSWTAVSENQRAQRKGARGVKALMMSSVLLTSLLSSNAVFAVYYGSNPDFGAITIGDNSLNNVKSDDHNFIGAGAIGDINVNFTSKDATLESLSGAEGLLSLANNGHEQILIRGGDLVVSGGGGTSDWDPPAATRFVYAGAQTVYQDLNENGNKVADLVFAVGNRAYKLFNENKDIFGIVTGEGENGFNGVRFSSNADPNIVYSEEGLALRRANNAPQEGLWLMTLLTDINLRGGDSGLTLDFSGVSIEQSLTARLNGEGNITYVGQSGNVLNISALIQRDENGAAYYNANSYTGSTFVKGLTLN